VLFSRADMACVVVDVLIAQAGLRGTAIQSVLGTYLVSKISRESLIFKGNRISALIKNEV